MPAWKFQLLPLFTIPGLWIFGQEKEFGDLLDTANQDNSFRIIMAGKQSSYVQNLLILSLTHSLISENRLYSLNKYHDSVSESCLFPWRMLFGLSTHPSFMVHPVFCIKPVMLASLSCVRIVVCWEQSLKEWFGGIF